MGAVNEGWTVQPGPDDKGEAAFLEELIHEPDAVDLTRAIGRRLAAMAEPAERTADLTGMMTPGLCGDVLLDAVRNASNHADVTILVKDGKKIAKIIPVGECYDDG